MCANENECDDGSDFCCETDCDKPKWIEGCSNPNPTLTNRYSCVNSTATWDSAEESCSDPRFITESTCINAPSPIWNTGKCTDESIHTKLKCEAAIGHGGRRIRIVSDGAESNLHGNKALFKTPEECEEECSRTEGCNCFVMHGNTECFLRKNCEPEKCASGGKSSAQFVGFEEENFNVNFRDDGTTLHDASCPEGYFISSMTIQSNEDVTASVQSTNVNTKIIITSIECSNSKTKSVHSLKIPSTCTSTLSNTEVIQWNTFPGGRWSVAFNNNNKTKTNSREALRHFDGRGLKPSLTHTYEYECPPGLVFDQIRFLLQSCSVHLLTFRCGGPASVHGGIELPRSEVDFKNEDTLSEEYGEFYVDYEELVSACAISAESHSSVLYSSVDECKALCEAINENDELSGLLGRIYTCDTFDELTIDRERSCDKCKHLDGFDCHEGRDLTDGCENISKKITSTDKCESGSCLQMGFMNDKTQCLALCNQHTVSNPFDDGSYCSGFTLTETTCILRYCPNETSHDGLVSSPDVISYIPSKRPPRCGGVNWKESSDLRGIINPSNTLKYGLCTPTIESCDEPVQSPERQDVVCQGQSKHFRRVMRRASGGVVDGSKRFSYDLWPGVGHCDDSTNLVGSSTDAVESLDACKKICLSDVECQFISFARKSVAADPILPLTGDTWSPSHKLGLCEGDCDGDQNCQGNLHCHHRNDFSPIPGCSGVGHGAFDYCVKSGETSGVRIVGGCKTYSGDCANKPLVNDPQTVYETFGVKAEARQAVADTDDGSMTGSWFTKETCRKKCDSIDGCAAFAFTSNIDSNELVGRYEDGSIGSWTGTPIDDDAASTRQMWISLVHKKRSKTSNYDTKWNEFWPGQYSCAMCGQRGYDCFGSNPVLNCGTYCAQSSHCEYFQATLLGDKEGKCCRLARHDITVEADDSVDDETVTYFSMTRNLSRNNRRKKSRLIGVREVGDCRMYTDPTPIANAAYDLYVARGSKGPGFGFKRIGAVGDSCFDPSLECTAKNGCLGYIDSKISVKKCAQECFTLKGTRFTSFKERTLSGVTYHCICCADYVEEGQRFQSGKNPSSIPAQLQLVTLTKGENFIGPKQNWLPKIVTRKDPPSWKNACTYMAIVSENAVYHGNGFVNFTLDECKSKCLEYESCGCVVYVAETKTCDLKKECSVADTCEVQMTTTQIDKQREDSVINGDWTCHSDATFTCTPEWNIKIYGAGTVGMIQVRNGKTQRCVWLGRNEWKIVADIVYSVKYYPSDDKFVMSWYDKRRTWTRNTKPTNNTAPQVSAYGLETTDFYGTRQAAENKCLENEFCDSVIDFADGRMSDSKRYGLRRSGKNRIHYESRTSDCEGNQSFILQTLSNTNLLDCQLECSLLRNCAGVGWKYDEKIQQGICTLKSRTCVVQTANGFNFYEKLMNGAFLLKPADYIGSNRLAASTYFAVSTFAELNNGLCENVEPAFASFTNENDKGGADACRERCSLLHNKCFAFSYDAFKDKGKCQLHLKSSNKIVSMSESLCTRKSGRIRCRCEYKAPLAKTYRLYHGGCSGTQCMTLSHTQEEKQNATINGRWESNGKKIRIRNAGTKFMSLTFLESKKTFKCEWIQTNQWHIIIDSVVNAFKYIPETDNVKLFIDSKEISVWKRVRLTLPLPVAVSDCPRVCEISTWKADPGCTRKGLHFTDQTIDGCADTNSCFRCSEAPIAIWESSDMSRSPGTGIIANGFGVILSHLWDEAVIKKSRVEIDEKCKEICISDDVCIAYSVPSATENYKTYSCKLFHTCTPDLSGEGNRAIFLGKRRTFPVVGTVYVTSAPSQGFVKMKETWSNLITMRELIIPGAGLNEEAKMRCPYMYHDLVEAKDACERDDKCNGLSKIGLGISNDEKDVIASETCGERSSDFVKQCDGRCTQSGNLYSVIAYYGRKGSAEQEQCSEACAALNDKCEGYEWGEVRCSYCIFVSSTCRLLLKIDLDTYDLPTVDRFSTVQGLTLFSDKPECKTNQDPPNGGCTLQFQITKGAVARGPPDCTGVSTKGWADGRWSVDCYKKENSVRKKVYELRRGGFRSTANGQSWVSSAVLCAEPAMSYWDSRLLGSWKGSGIFQNGRAGHQLREIWQRQLFSKWMAGKSSQTKCGDNNTDIGEALSMFACEGDQYATSEEQCRGAYCLNLQFDTESSCESSCNIVTRKTEKECLDPNDTSDMGGVSPLWTIRRWRNGHCFADIYVSAVKEKDQCEDGCSGPGSDGNPNPPRDQCEAVGEVWVHRIFYLDPMLTFPDETDPINNPSRKGGYCHRTAKHTDEGCGREESCSIAGIKTKAECEKHGECTSLVSSTAQCQPSCSVPEKTTQTSCEAVTEGCSDPLLGTRADCEGATKEETWTEGALWRRATTTPCDPVKTGVCSNQEYTNKTDCVDSGNTWDGCPNGLSLVCKQENMSRTGCPSGGHFKTATWHRGTIRRKWKGPSMKAGFLSEVEAISACTQIEDCRGIQLSASTGRYIPRCSEGIADDVTADRWLDRLPETLSFASGKDFTMNPSLHFEEKRKMENICRLVCERDPSCGYFGVSNDEQWTLGQFSCGIFAQCTDDGGSKLVRLHSPINTADWPSTWRDDLVIGKNWISTKNKNAKMYAESAKHIFVCAEEDSFKYDGTSASAGHQPLAIQNEEECADACSSVVACIVYTWLLATKKCKLFLRQTTDDWRPDIASEVPGIKYCTKVMHPMEMHEKIDFCPEFTMQLVEKEQFPGDTTGGAKSDESGKVFKGEAECLQGCLLAKTCVGILFVEQGTPSCIFYQKLSRKEIPNAAIVTVSGQRTAGYRKTHSGKVCNGTGRQTTTRYPNGYLGKDSKPSYFKYLGGHTDCSAVQMSNIGRFFYKAATDNDMKKIATATTEIQCVEGCKQSKECVQASWERKKIGECNHFSKILSKRESTVSEHTTSYIKSNIDVDDCLHHSFLENATRRGQGQYFQKLGSNYRCASSQGWTTYYREKDDDVGSWMDWNPLDPKGVDGAVCRARTSGTGDHLSPSGGPSIYCAGNQFGIDIQYKKEEDGMSCAMDNESKIRPHVLMKWAGGTLSEEERNEVKNGTVIYDHHLKSILIPLFDVVKIARKDKDETKIEKLFEKMIHSCREKCSAELGCLGFQVPDTNRWRKGNYFSCSLFDSCPILQQKNNEMIYYSKDNGRCECRPAEASPTFIERIESIEEALPLPPRRIPPKPLLAYRFETQDLEKNDKGELLPIVHSNVGEIDAVVSSTSMIQNNESVIEISSTGEESSMISGIIDQNVREHTLEAWVNLSDLTENGAILSLVSEKTFHSILLKQGKWQLSSENGKRTRPISGIQSNDITSANRMIHIAVVISNSKGKAKIQIYQQGKVYGTSYSAGVFPSFPKGSDIKLVIGRVSGTNQDAALRSIPNDQKINALVKCVSLYDTPLSSEEINLSFQAGCNFEKRTVNQIAMEKSDIPSCQSVRPRTSAGGFGVCRGDNGGSAPYWEINAKDEASCKSLCMMTPHCVGISWIQNKSNAKLQCQLVFQDAQTCIHWQKEGEKSWCTTTEGLIISHYCSLGAYDGEGEFFRLGTGQCFITRDNGATELSPPHVMFKFFNDAEPDEAQCRNHCDETCQGFSFDGKDGTCYLYFAKQNECKSFVDSCTAEGCAKKYNSANNFFTNACGIINAKEWTINRSNPSVSASAMRQSCYLRPAHAQSECRCKCGGPHSVLKTSAVHRERGLSKKVQDYWRDRSECYAFANVEVKAKHMEETAITSNVYSMEKQVSLQFTDRTVCISPSNLIFPDDGTSLTVSVTSNDEAICTPNKANIIFNGGDGGTAKSVPLQFHREGLCIITFRVASAGISASALGYSLERFDANERTWTEYENTRCKRQGDETIGSWDDAVQSCVEEKNCVGIMWHPDPRPPHTVSFVVTTEWAPIFGHQLKKTYSIAPESAKDDKVGWFQNCLSNEVVESNDFCQLSSMSSFTGASRVNGAFGLASEPGKRGSSKTEGKKHEIEPMLECKAPKVTSTAKASDIDILNSWSINEEAFSGLANGTKNSEKLTFLGDFTPDRIAYKINMRMSNAPEGVTITLPDGGKVWLLMTQTFKFDSTWQQSDATSCGGLLKRESKFVSTTTLNYTYCWFKRIERNETFTISANTASIAEPFQIFIACRDKFSTYSDASLGLVKWLKSTETDDVDANSSLFDRYSLVEQNCVGNERRDLCKFAPPIFKGKERKRALCKFKIVGTCKNKAEMNNKDWFSDQEYGGPEPSSEDACKTRLEIWKADCDIDTVEMKYEKEEENNRLPGDCSKISKMDCLILCESLQPLCRGVEWRESNVHEGYCIPKSQTCHSRKVDMKAKSSLWKVGEIWEVADGEKKIEYMNVNEDACQKLCESDDGCFAAWLEEVEVVKDNASKEGVKVTKRRLLQIDENEKKGDEENEEKELKNTKCYIYGEGTAKSNDTTKGKLYNRFANVKDFDTRGKKWAGKSIERSLYGIGYDPKAEADDSWANSCEKQDKAEFLEACGALYCGQSQFGKPPKDFSASFLQCEKCIDAWGRTEGYEDWAEDGDVRSKCGSTFFFEHRGFSPTVRQCEKHESQCEISTSILPFVGGTCKSWCSSFSLHCNGGYEADGNLSCKRGESIGCLKERIGHTICICSAGTRSWSTIFAKKESFVNDVKATPRSMYKNLAASKDWNKQVRIEVKSMPPELIYLKSRSLKDIKKHGGIQDNEVIAAWSDVGTRGNDSISIGLRTTKKRGPEPLMKQASLFQDNENATRPKVAFNKIPVPHWRYGNDGRVVELGAGSAMVLSAVVRRPYTVIVVARYSGTADQKAPLLTSRAFEVVKSEDLRPWMCGVNGENALFDDGQSKIGEAELAKTTTTTFGVFSYDACGASPTFVSFAHNGKVESKLHMVSEAKEEPQRLLLGDPTGGTVASVTEVFILGKMINETDLENMNIYFKGKYGGLFESGIPKANNSLVQKEGAGGDNVEKKGVATKGKDEEKNENER
eukprot:g1626.t1